MGRVYPQSNSNVVSPILEMGRKYTDMKNTVPKPIFIALQQQDWSSFALKERNLGVPSEQRWVKSFLFLYNITYWQGNQPLTLVLIYSSADFYTEQPFLFVGISSWWFTTSLSWAEVRSLGDLTSSLFRRIWWN